MFSTMKGFNYRRLEITVLGARPMSEVGFRDVKIPPSVTRTNTTSPVGTESRTVSSTSSIVSSISIVSGTGSIYSTTSNIYTIVSSSVCTK